jgi:1-acyl-sn-glycerol-3-phosphate acyltransferase
MIRRNVRARFHRVYWQPPNLPEDRPFVVVPNHHGWHDGYIMYLALTKLKISFVDWITEFDSFPLFRYVGGMPFPADDPARRATTIRQSLQWMQRGGSLLLFAETELHRPPELLSFGRMLEFVRKKVPNSLILPVAIRYELSVHERPEAIVRFGSPTEDGQAARVAIEALLKLPFCPTRLDVLAEGTGDVNERWTLPKLGRKPSP